MTDQELLEEMPKGPADTLEVQSKEKRIRDDSWVLAVLRRCVARP